MKQLGKDTPEGFLPQVPDMADIFKRIGFDPETMASAPIESAQKKASDDLKRAYARLAATPDGEKIIEDLLDQTLRRSSAHPNPDAGIEQEALFSRERKGQNKVMTYIGKMIVDGRALSAPAARKRGKKS